MYSSSLVHVVGYKMASSLMLEVILHRMLLPWSSLFLLGEMCPLNSRLKMWSLIAMMVILLDSLLPSRGEKDDEE